MRVINRYLSHDFLITFGMTLLVFTFVMCVGIVIRAIDLLSRGVSGIFILKVFFYNVPFILSFSIPISVLTAVLLLFGRMSFDGEITAMRACGMSMWQIVSPLVLISIGLSIFCVYLTSELSPRSRYAQRQVLAALGAVDPVALLEEGRFVRDFPNLMVYIGKKDKNKVTDVVVYEMGDNGVERNIRAKSGEIRVDHEKKVLLADLYDVRIDQPDADNPLDPTRARFLSAQHYPVSIDFSKMAASGKRKVKKNSDMTFAELVDAIQRVRELYPELTRQDLRRQRMTMMVEANKRLGLSLACFGFTLLGAPLGLRSRRKESFVGIAISLALVFFFYFFIILADSLVGRPELRPDMIIWFPVFASELIGVILLARAN